MLVFIQFVIKIVLLINRKNGKENTVNLNPLFNSNAESDEKFQPPWANIAVITSRRIPLMKFYVKI